MGDVRRVPEVQPQFATQTLCVHLRGTQISSCSMAVFFFPFRFADLLMWQIAITVASYCLYPMLETSPTPYRRLWALRARSVPWSVRESVPENQGVRGSVRGSVSGVLLAPGPRVSKRCPESVSGVSGHLFDTLETLSGHLLDTLGPGAKRTPETLPRTLPRTPRFSGTLSRTLRGTLRAQRARSLL